MSSRLHQLVYCSAAAKPFSEPELAALLAKARTANSRANVTGLLLYHKGSFVQVLEGEKDVIEPLFEHISLDPRHISIVLLLSRPLTERQFADWSMGFVTGSALVEVLPGYTDFLRRGASAKEQASAAQGILDAFRQGRFRTYVEG